MKLNQHAFLSLSFSTETRQRLTPMTLLLLRASAAIAVASHSKLERKTHRKWWHAIVRNVPSVASSVKQRLGELVAPPAACQRRQDLHWRERRPTTVRRECWLRVTPRYTWPLIARGSVALNSGRSGKLQMTPEAARLSEKCKSRHSSCRSRNQHDRRMAA